MRSSKRKVTFPRSRALQQNAASTSPLTPSHTKATASSSSRSKPSSSASSTTVRSSNLRLYRKMDLDAVPGLASAHSVEPQLSPAVLSSIPSYFARPPQPSASLTTHPTETSALQSDTVQRCLRCLLASRDPTSNPFEYNEYGVPPLEREDHIDFLRDGLENEFDERFVAMDASRPWLVYWGLNGLEILGWRGVEGYREKVIKTFRPMQSPTGGFGGGYGQIPHLACSYAAILSLALVGGPEAFSLIDREAIWQWLGRLKHPSGGFQVCENGEMDTRGAYTAMVLITLLDLPLELPPDSPVKKLGGLKSFTDNLPQWLSSCQTYQGGIGGSPGNEAHGAYTFLAISCLCLLGPPHIMLRKYLNFESLIEWLAAVQNAPEGGFAGRMNKLVDGCYSHWCGGCLPIIQAALIEAVEVGVDGQGRSEEEGEIERKVGTRWKDLYSREGLVRYTLCCCQQKGGGLRDKPGKPADGYHTNYTLSALSQTQHISYYHSAPAVSPSTRNSAHTHTNTTSAFSPAITVSSVTATAFSWKTLPLRHFLSPNLDQTLNQDSKAGSGAAREGRVQEIGSERDKEKTRNINIVWDPDTSTVQPIHPIFVIPHEKARRMREWCERQGHGWGGGLGGQ